jgi:hypothetical protein
MVKVWFIGKCVLVGENNPSVNSSKEYCNLELEPLAILGYVLCMLVCLPANFVMNSNGK